MKTKSPKKEKRVFGVWWTCQTCPDSFSMPHAEMMAHIRDVHGIDTNGLKANRSMLTHIDGDDWLSSTYQWTFGDALKIKEHSCTKRNPAWGHGLL